MYFFAGPIGCNPVGIEALVSRYPLAALIGNASKKTPLHIIVSSCRDDAATGLQAILRQLSRPLAHLSSNLSVALSPKTERGHTPLHVAVLEKNIDLVRILVAAGSRIDTRDQLGRTPLEAAVRDSDAGIVAILLSAGASTRRLREKNTDLAFLPNENIREMIEYTSTEPTALTSLCRRTLTTHLGPALQLVSHELPKVLKDFIKYDEL